MHYVTLEEAIEDKEFARYLSMRDFDKCIEMLVNRTAVQELCQFIEEEGIDPFEYITVFEQDLLPTIRMSKIVVPNGIVRLAQNTFSYRTDIEEIELPETLNIIGERAFNSCGIYALHIPNSVRYIGAYCFKYCQNLETLRLPDDLRELESGMFLYCSNLEEVILPKNLEIINPNIFDHCNSMQRIYYQGTRDEWDSKVKLPNSRWMPPVLDYIECTDGPITID